MHESEFWSFKGESRKYTYGILLIFSSFKNKKWKIPPSPSQFLQDHLHVDNFI